ncbi:MAG: hypothetical protein ACRDLS_07980, partial [Solirubrobacteraceae bacterium]
MSTDGEQLLGNPELVEDVLDGIDAYLRSVPSFRRAHARGESFRGYFTATPQAAGLSTAEHLQGDRIETVSNGSPCPYDPDHSSPKKGSPIGIGVRFELPSGAIAALAALSVPAFPPRDAHDFLALSAFFAVDARGQRRAFRYRLVPRAGIVALDPAAHRRLPPQYLLSEMKTRLQDEPAEWDLVFQMAEPG